MVSLYLMGFKGHHVLARILSDFGSNFISYVVSSRDAALQRDYYEDIQALCVENNIQFFNRKDAPGKSESICLAIGWRWLFKDSNNLVVVHDSLLPRYRGFNPLVTALLEGDTTIGATAICATKDFDAGDIIAFSQKSISYPVTIQAATEIIATCYSEICHQICTLVATGKPLPAVPQNNLNATYSLWRDDMDYYIDWQRDAQFIKRFIDALGYPYKGACSTINDTIIRITSSEVYPDLVIVNRTAGKVFKIENDIVHVVCGTGILGVTAMEHDITRQPFLLDKVRTRFV